MKESQRVFGSQVFMLITHHVNEVHLLFKVHVPFYVCNGNRKDGSSSTFHRYPRVIHGKQLDSRQFTDTVEKNLHVTQSQKMFHHHHHPHHPLGHYSHHHHFITITI